MEMCLRPPRSPLDPRSAVALAIRPAGSGRRHHPVQFFLTTGRFTGNRIVRCMVSSSDSPSKKSRRMVSPHVKVSSRGYAPRLTVESSTKKKEHGDSDEETLGTYNMLLSNDVTGWTGSRDAEAAKVDLIQNASSSPITRDVDADDENMFGMNMTGIAMNNVTLGKVDAVDDEAGVEEDIFKVDLSENISKNTIMGEVIVVSESGTAQDTFQTDPPENVSNHASMGGVDSFDEAEVLQDMFDADFLGQALSSATVEEVHSIDEAEVVQDMFHDDLLENVSSSAKIREIDLVNEVEVVQGMFDVDLSEKVMSSAKLMEVDYVNQVGPEQGTLHADLLENVISSPTREKVDMVDEAGNDQRSFNEHLQGIVLNGATYGEENMVDESISVQHKFEEDLPENVSSSAAFEEVDAMDKTRAKQVTSEMDPHVSSRPHLMPLVGLEEQGEPILISREQEGSSATSYGNQPMDKQDQDQSNADLPEQNKSIIDSHEQDNTIVDVPEQIQSIVGPGKQELSIISSSKQDRSIVSAPRQKQSIVGFDKQELSVVSLHKQNLSIVGTSEKQPVTMDGLPLAEEGIRIGDKLQHVLSEEEFSCAKDEVEIIESNKQYIQEPPHDYVEPEALRRMLLELADKNYSMGVKLFVFPEVVKPDSTIDIYFNRDVTKLASEPDVLIKGAFNGWRWKIFSERLHKSELGGVWWSCKLYIPKEAYKINFVFFNGRSVYENNDNNDFVIEVQSTMDQDLFEDFLAKEKKLELERLATEEAKRMRQTKEQRREEEERVADEAIRAQVKAEIQMKKIKLKNMLSSARTCADNLWYLEASKDGRGDKIRLYYNRNSRPLGHSTDIWMHGGYNNWNAGLSFVERLVKCDDKDGDWWYADVTIPEKALVLDWVLADGLPGKARSYDNNGRRDFHAILPNIMDEEVYWEEDELSIYTRLVQERREREEAIKIKIERSAKMKAEMKAKTMRRFLLSQKDIVYTEPLEIHAGTTVDVIYNPSNTVLNGRPEVWFRCCFNLWMHPGGALPPQKMVKSKDGMLLKATVSVPPDAYMMDFVFSESEEGGIYDNRNGMDYHIPIIDSAETETNLHIVHIAVEMAPIAKVGGLGDVVTSLSRAVQDLGHRVEVILPKHDCLNQKNVKNLRLYKSFSWRDVEIKVWVGLVEDLTVYFLEPQNGMFGVGSVYGRNDDRRFGFFCHSALEFILQNGSSPHIIHCHDWSSAPVAWLYKEHYAQSRLASARVVFTIHNLEFGAHYIAKAMTACDKATTVSHTYSKEVQGHGAIAPHREKFYGILNGIDPDIWDPYTDDFIPLPYTPENVVEGKHAAKRALQQKLGLQQTDVPIVGIITRLTAQKGIHLIKHAIHRTLESNGQVVLLGSAPDHRIQSDFCRLADELHGVYHGQAKLVLNYDEPLSHLIYAGSDFILVPSIFEPCGLTQLVAMRYGSIPVVRRTGGLYDTVFDVEHDKDRARCLGLEPNGFGFDGADSNGVDYALNRAIGAWFEAREWFQSLCKRVMEQDWSWNRPALDYIQLYHSARK